MATYLRPGVFVEEVLQPLTDPSLEASDSIAAFIGTSSKGGPLGPTLVTSWSQYQALFGDIRGSQDDLAYGVYTYFNNGGSRCYVVRAVNSNATAASLTLNDSDSDGAGSDTAEPTLTVTSKAPGVWASAATSTSRIFITVQTSGVGRFNLIVEVGSGSTLLAREQWDDLTLDPLDPRYAVTVVNSPTVGSNYVTLTKVGTFGDDVTASTTGNPAAVVKAPLTGGSDGTGSPDLYAATQRLDNVDAILNVNLPGVSDTSVLTNVINWAEAAGTRFVVVDPPKPDATDAASDVATDLTTLAGGLPKSSYAAIYGPWVYITDPAAGVPGALRLVAPGGGVLGQFVRNDVTRGVHKAPAGTEASLRAINAFVRFTDAQLDTLNSASVNVIRSIPGFGFCIFGARTLATRTPDRYVNVRRTLIAVKRGILNITRFAIFEPNDEILWENLSAIVSQFLSTQFQLGVLRGDVPDQAFYVKCDEDNNPAGSVNAGVVTVEVGVALRSPAEFIVIRIGQFDGGSTADETVA
jgi:phage tail sheath protein FI